MATESIEALGYVIGFWRFVFSPRFRNEWLSSYRTGNHIDQFYLLFQATISFLVGVFVLFALVYLLVAPRGA